MKKYLVGGKAVGSSASTSSPASSAQTNSAFASLLAQRSAQDASLWKQTASVASASVIPKKEQTQLVVVEKPSNNSKASDIDLILNGDYE